MLFNIGKKACGLCRPNRSESIFVAIAVKVLKPFLRLLGVVAVVAAIIVLGLLGSDRTNANTRGSERGLINPLYTDKDQLTAEVYPLNPKYNRQEEKVTLDVDIKELPDEVIKKSLAKEEAHVEAVVSTKGGTAAPSKEARHVAFLKVHKTGSSTMQNVFLRFGDTRNLTFILGKKKHNDCWRARGHPQCISFDKTIIDAIIVPVPEGKSFDILVSHVIYDRNAFRHYFPPDTKYISLVREPVSRQASAIPFFELFPFVGGNHSTYAKNPLKYDHEMLNNRMAYEFGFDKAWFPSANQTRLPEEVKPKVFAYINGLFNDFDLIMLKERFEESLVLLKRLLGWSTSDITYHTQLRQRHATFAPEEEQVVKNFLYLDYMLYERAAAEFQAKVAAAGPDFMDEVEYFHEVNKVVQKVCVAGLQEGKTFEVTGTRWDKGFTVTKKYCDDLLRTEVPYLDYIRKKQYGDQKT